MRKPVKSAKLAAKVGPSQKKPEEPQALVEERETAEDRDEPTDEPEVGNQQVGNLRDEGSPTEGRRDEPKAPQPVGILSLRLSASLFDKLRKVAQDEGIGLESFASELIAEGLVLRAWEIAERRNTMRQQAQQQQQPYGRPNNQQNHRNDNRRRGNKGPGGRPRPGMPNNSWMEDKAAFLEYVRNQEKGRR